jgi:hypothetical protein
MMVRVKAFMRVRQQSQGWVWAYIWGHRLVFLGLVPPKSSLPVGVACYPPAPELRAWDKQEKALKQQGGAKTPRPAKPSPQPHYPPTQALALRLCAPCKAPHPDVRVHCITADAL